jgi:hypothetical protein
MENRVYKYRMDFYYQLLVIYLVFFVLYALIRGQFFEEKFQLVFNDPIIYILILFIALFLVIVLTNIVRNRRIILKDDRVVLKNRFGSREILFGEILNIKIGKRRKRNRDVPYRIIKLKLLHRRKWLRIRANEYERGPELIKEFLNIKHLHQESGLKD